jgi:hypothetical protein
MTICVEAGGSITGEHGVGADKLDYMPLIFDAESLRAMCAVRRVFDPEQRANPRKVVPVHYCKEWGPTVRPSALCPLSSDELRHLHAPAPRAGRRAVEADRDGARAPCPIRPTQSPRSAGSRMSRAGACGSKAAVPGCPPTSPPISRSRPGR